MFIEDNFQNEVAWLWDSRKINKEINSENILDDKLFVLIFKGYFKDIFEKEVL